MIQLTRKQMRSLRQMLRQAFAITRPRKAPAVTFTGTVSGVTVRAATPDVVLCGHLPTLAAAGTVTLPYSVLRACEGRRDDSVLIVPQGESAELRWSDRGIPQSLVCETAAGPEAAGAEEAEVVPVPPELLRALRDACEVASKQAERFALHCLRLRGSDGQIAATDGRQALLQTGFTFPWSDELLVPANRLLQQPEFVDGTDPAVGRAGDWFSIRSGDWTLQLRLAAGRFPQIDDLVPDDSSARTVLTLSARDVWFLQGALYRLPGADDPYAPVTGDLNGSVAFRGRGENQPRTVEVVLSESQRSGEELRFVTDRSFLRRALQLGFEEIRFKDAKSVVCCRDGSRAYLWMPLQPEAAIPPFADAERILSRPQTPASPRRDLAGANVMPASTPAVHRPVTSPTTAHPRRVMPWHASAVAAADSGGERAA